MHDRWIDRLSEYLDGELAVQEHAALEEHLRECRDCRETLAGLRQVVAAAGRAQPAPPEHDLWAGIEARIAPHGARPIAFPPPARQARRFSFTFPQLAAAAAIFLLLGAGGLYLGMLRLQPADAGAPAAVTAPAPTPARLASTTFETQAGAISELEQALARDRNRLDPATVRVLEQSIATIDRAIADAQAAIAQDPADPYLRRHLDGAMKKKIDILRRAVTSRRAAS